MGTLDRSTRLDRSALRWSRRDDGGQPRRPPMTRRRRPTSTLALNFSRYVRGANCSTACLPYKWSIVTLHHKTNKKCMAQFCVMARNRWSGSAWVIFRFWYILKEQSFFYIILKFGSIKRIISRVFCCFSRPIFLRSDGRCDHNTCPIISL